MKFQPGDKVKFLNEKGGGIVKRIIDSSTVELSIEEGFDVPVLISNLIKVASDNASEKLFDVHYKIENNIATSTESNKTSRESLIASSHETGLQPDGIYLLWRPHNQKLLITGLVDVIIVNNTSFDILYNIFQRTSTGFLGIDYGSIGPEAMLVVDTCESGDLGKWMDGVMQIMFHSEDCPQLISPVEAGFRTKASKFLKEEHFTETPFIKERAYAMRVYELTLPGEEKEQKTVHLKPQNDIAIIAKHNTANGEAEVDLHIYSLVENTIGLNPSQMMDIQLDYVRRSLESAIAAGYEKVVYIHGVGAGVLKIELRKLLDSYDFIEFYDASIAKYGIGATEVLIHKNKK
jgi:hypothetical protein